MRNIGSKKYTYNESFFKNINTEEKAYWIGFICADGTIICNRKCHKYSVRIELQSRDDKHLSKFVNSICGNRILRYESKKSALLVISSKIMVFDLVNKGYCSPKTVRNVFPPPYIRNNLIRHYIRGYFDGDGSWYLSKAPKRKLKRDLRFSLVSANKNFCVALQKWLIRYCKVSKSKIRKNGNIFHLHYHGDRQLDRIYHKLYDGKTICLDRKYDIVKNYLGNCRQ